MKDVFYKPFLGSSRISCRLSSFSYGIFLCPFAFFSFFSHTFFSVCSFLFNIFFYVFLLFFQIFRILFMLFGLFLIIFFFIRILSFLMISLSFKCLESKKNKHPCK